MKDARETILFVDDEESILEISEDYFHQKGYEVLIAKNGLDAIEILEENKVDCCFTDINMPEMDGLQLAEYIRKYDNTLPVIVMTGYPSLENTIKTLQNGVVDFLIKPVNLNQMEVCVRRVMRERALFVDNILLKKELKRQAKIQELNRELLYKVDELHLLNKIMDDFTTVETNEDMFRKATQMGMEIVHADEVAFYVITDGVDYPHLVATESVSGVEAADPDKDVIDRLIMETVKDDIPLLISDNLKSMKAGVSIRSFMIVPLKIRDNTFGVLTAAVKEGDTVFTEKELYYLSFISQKAAYVIENIGLYENIYENFLSTLLAFVAALEAKDPYTKQHSNRVAELSKLIGAEFGCTKDELDVLEFAGKLHDIGKIGIRDEVLLKPGRLTEEEFAKIKEHPVIGADIVTNLGMWNREREIIRYHHERFDGTGYPEGLSGEDIPVLARVLSVADAYDAMASDRAYRKKLESERIVSIIKECSGTQFDPEMVKAFLRVYESGAINQISFDRR